MIEVYAQANGDLSLVMVGWAPYADRFVRKLREAKDHRVRFLGPRYGMQYLELLANAFAYIQATKIGGTHPALVEAMGFDNRVLVNDTPENRETAGDQAIYFQADNPETLTQAINALLANPSAVADQGRQVELRTREQFSWERTADTLTQIFHRLAPQDLSTNVSQDIS